MSTKVEESTPPGLSTVTFEKGKVTKLVSDTIMDKSECIGMPHDCSGDGGQTMNSLILVEKAPSVSDGMLPTCECKKKQKSGCSRMISSIRRIFSSCVKAQAVLQEDNSTKTDPAGQETEVKQEESEEEKLCREMENVTVSADSSPISEYDCDGTETLPITSISTASPAVQSLLTASPFNNARLDYHRKEIMKTLSTFGSLFHTEALLPEVAAEDSTKKCLVLDLDETLIHSQFQRIPNPDMEVQMNMQNSSTSNIYVSKRPKVDEFLEFVGKHFEVVIFTASLAFYADPVIDALDKTKTIKHRLYRESCLNIDGFYIKDLSKLRRPIDQVILIDNAPSSYLLHPENGVAVRSWFSDPDDDELIGRLKPALEDLVRFPDVYAWKSEWEHSIHHLLKSDA